MARTELQDFTDDCLENLGLGILVGGELRSEYVGDWLPDGAETMDADRSNSVVSTWKAGVFKAAVALPLLMMITSGVCLTGVFEVVCRSKFCDDLWGGE